MITINKLNKSFGDIKAVKDVSFVAENSKVTGLLGPNGAGKTTTLRMLYGLLSPDSGSISIDGQETVSNPQLARLKMGVLPDSHGVYQRLTSREHIRYFGRLRGLPDSNIKQRSEELVELLEMQNIIDRKTSGFSHGERMKVSLASALVHNPSHVLLDEPTNGLDVNSTRAVRAIIRKLKDSNVCIIFSSHIMQEVSALCDNLVIIADGMVKAIGAPDEMLKIAGEEDLEEAFLKIADSQEAL